MKSFLKTVLILSGAAVSFLALIQLIPINHINPPVVTQVAWDSPQTQALFERACADCHSNQTTWPWYSSIAPVSWLVAHDVQEGRQHFNLSNLSAGDPRRMSRLPEEVSRQIQDGRMPVAIYLVMHPSANLTPAEKQALIDGLEKTLAATLAQQN
jgi:hypothetical protein